MKWTLENCKMEASKYKTKTDFSRGSSGAYDAAWRKGWLDLFFNKDKHTFDECKEESLKYNSRSEFSKNSFSFYWTSKKNGWLDLFYGKLKTLPKKYWDYENCMKESKKYKSRIEFCEMSSGAYYKSTRNGWIEDFVWLKTPTLPDKLEEKENIIYVYEDRNKKVAYIGRTINLKRRHIQHNCPNRKEGKYDSIKQYFISINKELPLPKILEEKLTYEESQEKEDYWKNYYVNDGWLVLNKAKTGKGSGSLGRVYRKWTYEICQKESEKYETRTKFKTGCKGAYEASVRNKWINDFFKDKATKK